MQEQTQAASKAAQSVPSRRPVWEAGLAVYAIPQADGATRLVALDAADYETVRRDVAALDCVDALACLDVERDGAQSWVRLFRGRDTQNGRAAIRAYVAEVLL